MDLQFAIFGHIVALICPCSIGRYNGDAGGLGVKLEMPVQLFSAVVFFFNLSVCIRVF